MHHCVPRSNLSRMVCSQNFEKVHCTQTAYLGSWQHRTLADSSSVRLTHEEQGEREMSSRETSQENIPPSREFDDLLQPT
jgi:hypothetical protein